MNNLKLVLYVWLCGILGTLVFLNCDNPGAGALVGGIIGFIILFVKSEIARLNTAEGQTQEKKRDKEQLKFENTEWIKKD